MTLRFNTKRRVCAIGCASLWLGSWLGSWLFVGTGLARGEEARAARASSVTAYSDESAEVLLAPASRLPLYGPRYAPVTIDLYLPLGHKLVPPILEQVEKAAEKGSDVRVLFHPVLGSEAAERGAELVFCAMRQGASQERWFAFLLALASHPEWLGAGQGSVPVPSLDQEAAIREAAEAAGLDGQELLGDLRRHAERARVAEIWQRERIEVRSPPEIWVNGRRMRGLFHEAQLAEELTRQRARAYKALREGVRLTALYEELVAHERGERPARGEPPRGGTPAAAQRMDLVGSPLRGPKVSPVTLVIVGSLDSYGTFRTARAAQEAWAQKKDAVRLSFQHAPSTESGRRVALLLGALSYVDPEAFWRAFDGILELGRQRFFLRDSDVSALLARQRVDVQHLEAVLRDPVQGEAVRATLLRDLQQAQRVSTPSVPRIVVNGRILPGSPSAEQIGRSLQEELRRGFFARLRQPGP
jgi:hypothetical protein